MFERVKKLQSISELFFATNLSDCAGQVETHRLNNDFYLGLSVFICVYLWLQFFLTRLAVFDLLRL